MKYITLILLLTFAGCKKKDKEPEPEDPIVVVPDPIVRKTNTITVRFKTYCPGYETSLRLKSTDTGFYPYEKDTVYYTKGEKIVTMTTDRKFLTYFFLGEDKEVAGQLQPCNVDVDIKINDTLYKSWSATHKASETISLYK
jgi:hypothetical protein